MERTLVAIFDDQSDAQQALNALRESGFSTSNARLTSAESSGAVTGRTAPSAPEHEESFGEKVANFFGFGDQDETYSEAVRRGSCVLTVDAASDDEAERAEEIINEYGPVDIDEREAEWRESGWQASRGRGGETTIPITEEQMQVGKRDVQQGGVRVVSRVSERPVEETVTLREEHATVKRQPADRAATDSDQAFKDRSFEVRGTAEEPVVSKAARVVEDVVIGKDSSTREQTVEGSVRRTGVDVEELGQGSGNGASRYSGPERRTRSSENYRGMERRA